MSSVVERLVNRFYPRAEEKSFLSLLLDEVSSRVRADSVLLDIGAGAGLRNAYSFRGRVQKMIGVDLDDRVRANPLLDEGLISDSGSLPLPDESVDVAFSIYVLEHIERPSQFCDEVFRVLKPGGVFVALTPNRFHYVPLIASLTPLRFHQWVNKKRGREVADTFPTHYRLNSRGALRAHLHRFRDVEFRMLEGCPQYLKFNAFTFLVGVCYERVVNWFSFLAGFRVNILVRATKPE